MLIGLTDRMRCWRFALLIVAIATMIGVGATAAHGALDASEPAALAQDHADKCFVVGLALALALAAVATRRRVRPARVEQLLAGIHDMVVPPPAAFAAAGHAGAPPPSSARLCRFLT